MFKTKTTHHNSMTGGDILRVEIRRSTCGRMFCHRESMTEAVRAQFQVVRAGSALPPLER